MSSAVRPLRDGWGGILLAVDFGSTRTEAGFADLAPLLEGDPPLYECVPPGLRGTAPAAPALDAYVGRWVDALEADGRQVRAVLGYCAGGPLGLALADRLGPGRDALPVIAFDAFAVTASFMAAEFRHRFDPYWATLDPAARAEVEATAEHLQRRPVRDLPAAGAAAAELFARLTAPILDELEVLPTIARELQAHLAAWLAYLAVASQVSIDRTDPRLTVVNSRDGHWTGAGAVLDVPVSRADLLRDPRAAAAVAAVLGRLGTAPALTDHGRPAGSR